MLSFVVPTYEENKKLKAEASDLEQVMAASKELQVEWNKRLQQFGNISDAEMDEHLLLAD